jgi:hypothetical protein
VTPDQLREVADLLEAERGRYTTVDGAIHFLRLKADLVACEPDEPALFDLPGVYVAPEGA